MFKEACRDCVCEFVIHSDSLFDKLRQTFDLILSRLLRAERGGKLQHNPVQVPITALHFPREFIIAEHRKEGLKARQKMAWFCGALLVGPGQDTAPAKWLERFT